MSTHEIGLKDVVESLMLLDKLPTIYFFVVSIEKVQPLSITLWTEIEPAVQELKKKMVALARAKAYEICDQVGNLPELFNL
jgi:hydrogenase maturation protease